VLDRLDHIDAPIARAMTAICPDCKRIHDAEAAQRRSNMERKR